MDTQKFWTKMAAEYGINVPRGQAWLKQEFGSDYEQTDEQALEAHLRGRFMAHGGYVHPDDPEREMKPWQAMKQPVARHHTAAAAKPAPEGDEEIPEGWVPYGQNIYPQEVIGHSPGLIQDEEKGVFTGVKVKKFPKRWRNAFQQAPRVEFSGLDDPIEMSIRGQGVGMGESVQRTQALVTMNTPAPEGAGYYDPSVGQAQNVSIRRAVLPEDVSPEQVQIEAGTEIGSAEPTELYEGHTGTTRADYLESSTVIQSGVRTERIDDEERNVLYYQTRDKYPTGAAIPVKSGPKMVPVPLRGLQEATGAQFAMPMRDPAVMAATAIGSMTSEEQKEIFGETVSGQMTEKQYKQYMESRDVRTHTLPPQVFQTDSDVYEALKPQLTNVQDIGEGRVRAQRQVTGYLTPFGIQAQQSYRFHAQTVTGEMYDAMTENQPRLASHVRDLGIRSSRIIAQVGGASLANAGVAEKYATVKAGDLDWGKASDAAQADVVERGYEDPTEAPAGIWHRAMSTALEKQTKGRGIEFPAPDAMNGRLVMPTPAATRHLGGVTSMEEQTWGLFRKYGKLISNYAESGGKLTPQYVRSLRSAGGALAEATQSGEFRRKQRGYVVSGMGGGRANPEEAMPANAIFMNRKLLEESLRGMAPDLDREQRTKLANRIFKGEAIAPRFRAWRYPLTRPREQMNMTLQYKSFPEFKKIMERPDMTMEEAEQLGSSAVMSPRSGEAQGGDWDWDPYAYMGVTRYSEYGAGHLSEVTPSQTIIERARQHPAGEHKALAEDIRDMPTPEKMAADIVSAGRFVPQEEINEAYEARAGAKSAVGVSSNFAMRFLRAEISGHSPAAKEAQAELGNIYMIGQDIGGMGAQAGPTSNLIRQFSRMNASTVAGQDPNTGEFFNYKTPSRWMSAVTKDVADLYKGDELGLSAQTRAVLMGGADNPNLGKITSLMEEYESAADSPRAQAKMLTRMRQLTVGKGKKGSVSVKEFTQASPTAGLIWSQAERRDADRRGTVEEKEYGSRGYAEAEEWQVKAGERGEAIAGMSKVRYRHGDYAQMPISDAAKHMATAVEKKVLEPAQTRRLRKKLAMMGYTGGGSDVPEPTTMPQVSTESPPPAKEPKSPVPTPPPSGAPAPSAGPSTAPTTSTSEPPPIDTASTPMPTSAGTAPSAETESMPSAAPPPSGGTISVAGDTDMGTAYNIISDVIGGDAAGPDASQLHRAAVGQARKTHDAGGVSAYRQGFNRFMQQTGLSASEATKVWGKALQRTGGPAFSARNADEGVGHQYRKYLRSDRGKAASQAAPSAAPVAASAQARTSVVPPAIDRSTLKIEGLVGGGQPSTGGGDQATTLLGGALAKAAQGSDRAFGLKITGGYTPGKGFNFSGGTFDTAPDAQLATKMHETIKIFDEQVKPALKDLGDTSGVLSKEQMKVTKQLGTMYGQIEKGLQGLDQMPVEDRPAGMIDQLSAAQKQLEQAGVPELAARAETQGRYGALIGGVGGKGGRLRWKGAAGGGDWGKAAGSFAGMATSYMKMMRMRRVWNMLGAPSFKNQQFAAQEQMAAYGAAQTLGFSAEAPGGVAGGLMRRQVQQARAKAAYGRAGYRTWGSGAGTVGSTVRGIYGPAAGGAALAGFGAAGAYGALSSAGLVAGGTAAGVGLTAAGIVAAPLAGVATSRWLRSYTKQSDTNEAALSPDSGLFAKVRARAGAFFGSPDVWNAPKRWRGVTQMQQQAAEEYDTSLPELDVPSRAAWLKRAAGNWAGKKDTVWQGADEKQYMSVFNQAASWSPWIGQMDYEQLNEQPPMMMERIQALGSGPEQYADVVQAAGGSREDVGSFYMGVTGPGTTQWSRQQATTALGQWGQLYSKQGVDSSQLIRGAQQGWLPAMSGQKLRRFQKLASGSRRTWAKQAAKGSYMGVQLDEVGLSSVEAETGMALYTTRGLNEEGPFYEPLDRIRDGASMIGGWGGMWGLQDQKQELSSNFAQQQYRMKMGALSHKYNFLKNVAHPRQRKMTQQRREIQGMQWESTVAGWGRQAEAAQQQFSQGMESIGMSRQIYLAQQGYQEEDLDDRREDENRRYERQLVRRGWQQQDWDWKMEDIQTGHARQETKQEWQREAWQMRDTQRSFARQQRQTQFQWQEEDINRQMATSSREFGWQMEDFSRNIRFASGRQRENLERQRKRATVRYASQRQQQGTQKDRLEKRKEWAKERDQMEEKHFELQKEHQEKRWEWQEEDYEKRVERHEEMMERLEQKWEWQDEDHERRLEQIDEQEERNEELHALRMQQFAMRERHLSESHSMKMGHAAAEQAEQTAIHEKQLKLREEQDELAELNREEQLVAIQHQMGMAAAAEEYRKKMEALNEKVKELRRKQEAQVADFESNVRTAFGDIVDYLDKPGGFESRVENSFDNIASKLDEPGGFKDDVNRVFKEIIDYLERESADMRDDDGQPWE